MGLNRSQRFIEEVMPVAPGDRPALYTDGITEAMNAGGEMFGEPGFRDLLLKSRGMTAGECVDKALVEVREFTSGNIGDDITIIVPDNMG